jgi:relaxase-like protein
MIGKISAPRGERVGPLIYYLYGPGRHEEHTDPHIVAGWWHPAELEPPLRADGGRDFRRLIGLLNQPHAAMGSWAMQRPVWHCSMRAAPGDRMLSDDEWAQVAHDVMNRTGLSPYGHEDDAVRWIAVRHGDDHIHIVAMLARQDGRRPRTSNDRYRVREACRAAEERYGLRRTAPGDRTAAPPPSRAESEKAIRNGRSEPPRITLRREVSRAAAAASSEEEFFARLRDSGILVRTRNSARNPGEVTGYAVALAGDATASGKPVWFGGGKLAADLTLPKLRHRWPGSALSPQGQLTATERAVAWNQALDAVDAATAHLRGMASGAPGGAADAAWAAAGTMHAAAALLGSKVLRRAADAYDRAARPPWARIPPPTTTGTSLRSAARLLSALAMVSGDPVIRPAVLVARLAALAEAVARMRESQQRAAQAASALSAARLLHAAARPAAGAGSRMAAGVAPGLAGASFPVMPGPFLPAPAAAPPLRPAAPASRPAPRQGR